MSDGQTVLLTAGAITRVMEVSDQDLRTLAIEVTGQPAIPVSSTELAVVLDVATWRHDIPVWHHRLAASGADDVGWQAPELDLRGWRVVPHLHPVLTARVSGDAWFRTQLSVPHAHADANLELVLGGLDDQDWGRYEVWVDGTPVADARGSGRIRVPHRVLIGAGSAAHTALTRGGGAWVAVRCSELSRELPDRVPGELEHHIFQDWLVDQYLATRDAERVVDDFVPGGWRSEGDTLEVELRSSSMPVLAATLRYIADGDVIRKLVRLANHGTQPIAVLDVVLDAWQGDLRPSLGGRGQPAIVGGAFVGIEHPAGVAQVDPTTIRMVQMPGRTLEAGATWDAHPVVVGGDGVDVVAAFRRHVEGLRPRPTTRASVYSALGWYDFTNPADPLPELTAELVAENLDQLEALADQGVEFDIYMFDDWWERTDLGSFRRATFPDGPGALVERLESMGMRAGLWWATTRAVWSAAETPGIEPSWANDPTHSARLDLAGGEWQWIEEFSNLFVGERRLCLASEPYRSIFLDAIPRQVAELRAALLKLDCVVLQCTSSAHDHRPGRHSVEPMVDAMVELLQRCEAASPDLRPVWYWGFRSPWYLRFGDIVFDKGLLMEAATVASSPAPTTRQSLTLNVDQAVRHARTLPLRLQDSLGVWIGDVAWCNRIGVAEWTDAMLMDIARGSDLVQLWGDLTLLGTDDVATLGALMPWLARQSDALTSAELGGDPWRGEAYGYGRPMDGGLVATVLAPAWQGGSVRVGADLDGFPDGAWRAIEVYPFPGLLESPGPGLSLELAPWETRVIWVAPARHDAVRMAPLSVRPAIRPSRRLDIVPGADGRASIALPAVGREDAVMISHRLRAAGEWHYDAEPQALVSTEVTLDGLAVASTLLPRTRDRNGPGSSWVLRAIPAGPSWSGRTLHVELRDETPAEVEVVTEAWLVERWWRRHRRRFRDPLTGPGSGPG
jgi:hypothetical protein